MRLSRMKTWGRGEKKRKERNDKKRGAVVCKGRDRSNGEMSRNNYYYDDDDDEEEEEEEEEED